MHFTHKFADDLKQIRFDGAPYALMRAADGEYAFCNRKPLKGVDGWNYDGSDTRIARKVLEAITADVEGLHFGISCPCCDQRSHKYYLSKITAPHHRVTYSNIFVNSNHAKATAMFSSLRRTDYILVACNNADIKIPANAINPEFDYAPVIQSLRTADRPIFVAAGPVKCGLIYDYWTTTPPERRQIIIDVGSMMDKEIHGKATRRYHTPNSPTASKTCRWSS